MSAIIIIYFAVAYRVMDYFDITCVFLEFMGIPCPGCGMTRALISVLNMNFVEAVKYNVMIFCMPYVFMYIILDFKNKIYKYLLIMIAVIAIINWIIKIIIFM